jgi:hypothetical protein
MAWCFSTLPRIGCAMRSARWWGGGKEGGALAFFWLLLLPLARTATCPRAFRAAPFRSPLHPRLCSAAREGTFWSWNVRESLDRRAWQSDRVQFVQFIGESWASTLPLKLVSGLREKLVWICSDELASFTLAAAGAWPWFRFLKGGASDWHVCFWCAYRVTSMENQVVDTVFLLDRLSVRYGWLDKIHEFIRVKTDSRVSEKPRLNRIRDTS